MIKLEVTSDIDEFVDNLDSEMTPNLAKGLLKAATFAGGAIAEQVNEMFESGSGELARSFLPARFVKTKSGELGAGAVSDVPYARIQDEGGTITPSKMTYLSIPVSSEAKNRWPRDWPAEKLFAFRSKNGNLLLAERTTRGKPTIHYVLKKSIEVTGKGYLEKAMAKAEPTITKIVDEAVQKAIDEADK